VTCEVGAIIYPTFSKSYIANNGATPATAGEQSYNISLLWSSELFL
jgi:hypothetical protein